MVVNPTSAVHWATSSNGVSGKGAVRGPSFMITSSFSSLPRSSSNGGPLLVFVTSHDRLRDQHHVVPVGEGRVVRLGAGGSGLHVPVDPGEQGTERVGEPFDVAPRICDEGCGLGGEERRTATEDRVGPSPVPDE